MNAFFLLITSKVFLVLIVRLWLGVLGRTKFGFLITPNWRRVLIPVSVHWLLRFEKVMCLDTPSKYPRGFISHPLLRTLLTLYSDDRRSSICQENNVRTCTSRWQPISAKCLFLSGAFTGTSFSSGERWLNTRVVWLLPENDIIFGWTLLGLYCRLWQNK